MKTNSSKNECRSSSNTLFIFTTKGRSLHFSFRKKATRKKTPQFRFLSSAKWLKFVDKWPEDTSTGVPRSCEFSELSQSPGYATCS